MGGGVNSDPTLSILVEGMLTKRKDLAPSKSPTMLDIAWAAGIWEGEGWVATSCMAACQKDPYILYKLQELFGGSVGNKVNANRSTLYRWLLCGTRARGFALTIFSFMSPRRKEQIKATLFTRGDRKKRSFS